MFEAAFSNSVGSWIESCKSSSIKSLSLQHREVRGKNKRCSNAFILWSPQSSDSIIGLLYPWRSCWVDNIAVHYFVVIWMMPSSKVMVQIQLKTGESQILLLNLHDNQSPFEWWIFHCGDFFLTEHNSKSSMNSLKCILTDLANWLEAMQLDVVPDNTTDLDWATRSSQIEHQEYHKIFTNDSAVTLTIWHCR